MGGAFSLGWRKCRLVAKNPEDRAKSAPSKKDRLTSVPGAGRDRTSAWRSILESRRSTNVETSTTKSRFTFSTSFSHEAKLWDLMQQALRKQKSWTELTLRRRKSPVAAVPGACAVRGYDSEMVRGARSQPRDVRTNTLVRVPSPDLGSQLCARSSSKSRTGSE